MWGWLLTKLPEAVLSLYVYGILITGIVLTLFTFVMSNVPGINLILKPFSQYIILIKILAVVLLLSGMYLKGAYDTELMYRDMVKDLKVKIQQAEIKSLEINTNIDKKVTKEYEVIKDVQVVVKEKIVKVKEVINAQCKVHPEAINILNFVVRNKLEDPNKDKVLEDTKE